MRLIVAALLVVVTSALLAAGCARACQLPPLGPPYQVSCHLHAESECWRPGEPIRISFSFTNRATDNPFPPPYQDDAEFTLTATAAPSARLWSFPLQWRDDDDGDGVIEYDPFAGSPVDNCPDWPNADQSDGDADGRGDPCDNCPLVWNYGQEDGDGDGVGDACPGGDADGDGVADAVDDCPVHADPAQLDTDGDGFGDACDTCPEVADDQVTNSDQDSFRDACDVCPLVRDPSQEDSDGDGIGDACEPDGDRDGDGHSNAVDNCPDIANPLQEDGDSDGRGNACDACPAVSDPSQENADGDQWGDLCDNCPRSFQYSQLDADADGVGDACDEDSDQDADGLTLLLDNCPARPNPDQADSDGDGVGDACDNCRASPNPEQGDRDADGFGDACDSCPDVLDYGIDSDGDGIPDEQRDTDGDGLADACDGSGCWDGRSELRLEVEPRTVVVVLDDVDSPFADQPGVHVQDFLVMPPVDPVAFSFSVQLVGPNGNLVCSKEICITACPVETEPWLLLGEAIQTGTAGERLGFELGIDSAAWRAGRSDPDEPIVVKLVRENPSDPIDLFPVWPPELLTTGVSVTEPEATVVFECGLHGPCYGGVSNAFHVMLETEGGELIHDSRDRFPEGIARAVVDRAPVALHQVLEVMDDGCNERLAACEHGFVRLLSIARAAFLGSDLREVTLEVPLPPGLELVDWSLHHHDNPMDAEDPDMSELDALGEVTITPGLFTATTTLVVDRYGGDPRTPPTVFRDLFEAELLFETPADGLGDVSELVFPGARVRATVDVAGVPGPLVDETSPERWIPVDPSMVPPELGLDRPIRVEERGTVRFPVLPEADRHELHRGTLTGLHEGRGPDCLDAMVMGGERIDAEPPSDGLGWYYLVAGRNCAGRGSLGGDSFGSPRAPRTECP